MKKPDYIPRWAETALLGEIENSPVVMLLGARQVGKTTLLRNCLAAKGWTYMTADDPDQMVALAADPKAILRGAGDVILDEFQHMPDGIDKVVKLLVDNGERVRFVLTGSSTSGMLRSLGDSMAGRSSIVSMYPPAPAEWPEKTDWTKGMLPRVRQGYRKEEAWLSFWKGYEVAIVQKDIPAVSDIRNTAEIYRLCRLLADRAGCRINFQDMARDMGGVALTTVKRWVNALEAVGVVELLPPWVNASSRFRKSPKLYFFDPGFASYLGNTDGGSLFENAAFTTLRAWSSLKPGTTLFWYLDRNNREIDFILQGRESNIGFEAKNTPTVNSVHAKNLIQARREGLISEGYVLFNGEGRHQLSEGIFALGLGSLTP
ncbi:MAG TPA: ATP-binding protein [Synergistales bacterium]|jgi:hypothetical protein|nr:hypothetical protein [Synergistaceae bacterium]HQO83842.1 ATP-binding protein [Synergistales bacterium]